jgi:antitoxin (DNA-binding transcriptional repressor) of toxin-antitoxin stability system
VLAKVQQGVEIVIEPDHRPVAVISASQPRGRNILEILAELKARDSKL